MKRLTLTLAAAAVALAPLAPATAFAQDQPPAPEKPAAPAKPPPPAERTFKDGKLADPYWGLAYEVPGLAETKGFGTTGKLFEGKAGDVAVEILVHEGEKERTAGEWREASKKAWADRKREMKEPAEGDDPAPWVAFVEETLSGQNRHHGYAFQARGLHGFIVHAYVAEKSETSLEAVRKALAGLKLGEDTGASLMAQFVAQQMSRAPDDPIVLLKAGADYLQEQPGMKPNPALAERVLERALRTAKPDAYSADEQWELHENLGLATLMQRKTQAAIGWFSKSTALAEKTSAPTHMVPQSSYNLACAFSVAGRVEEAFAALEKSFAGGAPVSKQHLESDPDLENLRKDPRWPKFVERAGAEVQ